MAFAAASRRAAATMTATAHDARRVSSESARLVSMIGTRAPNTIPAASALGEKRQAFGQHVSGFEVRNHQDVRAARDRRRDFLNFSGLQADRVVECQRTVQQRTGNLTAIRHLA